MIKLRTKKAPEINVTCDGLELKAVHITSREKDDLLEACTTTKGRGDNAVTKVDNNAFLCRLFCKTITGWNASDEDGNPLDCNDANKKLVFEYDTEFAAEMLAAVRNALNARQEVQEKN
jgi:hypothetical protein